MQPELSARRTSKWNTLFVFCPSKKVECFVFLPKKKWNTLFVFLAEKKSGILC